DIATKLAPAIKEADAIILSDYAKGIITTETIKQIQSIARPETIIALDPKPRPSISYTGLSVMTPNRSEAYKLAGINEDEITDFPAELVCKRIYEKYSPKSLIITLGADGMLLSENGEVVSKVPTYAREVFDVSGAGDTVIAALSVALATGASMLDAIHFANTAAGFVVGKLGTATATPEDIIAYASNK
ncbi:MAG: bifunctional hydroxymethylpyrimidine kinase/phosphomethylpyrimidine kinase, partial [Kiritimatiellae bacterium]|nr:bifunctional hydroxymethylpyrimidine kinase/phosphomethylpyrimidine kinase [Kiritimatiellia bacterium]